MERKGGLLGLVFVSYCLATLALAFWLSHHPLAPAPQPADGDDWLARALAADLATPAADFAPFLARLSLLREDGSLRARAPAEPLPDFAAIADTSARKQAFFAFLRPLVARQNRLVQERRVLLRGLQIHQAQGLAPREAQRQFLARMRRHYKVPEALDDAAALALLWRRADLLPESMVLAQAAMESAWGTSRFAREGNNLFGQWCFSEGCGLVPNGRLEGARHEVKTFASVADAIAAYYRNLNAFHRYADIRSLRETARAANRPLRGEELVVGLVDYSARGQAYIDELRALMRANRLE